MNGIKDLIVKEPVLLQGLVQAGIAMLVGFGLGWTADQVALVLAFTATLLAVVARTLVTPTVTAAEAVKDAKQQGRAQAIVQQAMTANLSDEQIQAELDRLDRAVQAKQRGL